ncbi:hypothetical protein [Paracoccus sediminicola]|uniref:hypothetical protein n=1 Tax=Paracoccus sediminicola TaxID=3017783 RepID=UPI0022F0D384|nr:hypothetical protein [Paracoccus sediminicola]WBU56960.1 hypothetical protein PAF18_00500 [Paracoccus sediminicola]
MLLAFYEDQNKLPSYIVDMDEIEPNLIAAVFLIPNDPAMWIMMSCVWLAALAFAWQTVTQYRNEQALPLADIGLLVGAFLCAAIWPWVGKAVPLAGLLISILTLMSLIAAVSRKLSDGRLGRNPLIGILLGWSTMLSFSAFASFINDAMAIPSEIASLVGAILACTTTMAIQLRIPQNALYAITVMFAFLAIAATMIEAAPVISVIAVLSIASLTFLLVRVTT